MYFHYEHGHTLVYEAIYLSFKEFYIPFCVFTYIFISDQSQFFQIPLGSMTNYIIIVIIIHTFYKKFQK